MKVQKCNICGYPDRIIYKERSTETGMIVERNHVVKCPGHEGIHPRLWNQSSTQVSLVSNKFLRSPIYDDYLKAAISQKKRGKKK